MYVPSQADWNERHNTVGLFPKEYLLLSTQRGLPVSPYTELIEQVVTGDRGFDPIERFGDDLESLDAHLRLMRVRDGNAAMNGHDGMRIMRIPSEDGLLWRVRVPSEPVKPAPDYGHRDLRLRSYVNASR